MTKTDQNQFDHVVVLTGAGISAESGLSTFRDNNGLWDNHRIEDVATPDAFMRDPDLVHRFYNARRSALNTVEPNSAHVALATASLCFKSFTLVTQNVDDLHERAGSLDVVHMHGQLLEKNCVHCHQVSHIAQDMGVHDQCEHCGEVGGVRPNIVWFGEMPFHMDEIMQSLMGCDLFVSIGTSGTVYPAAGFVEIANRFGAHTVELNLEVSDQHSEFHMSEQGPASELVPAFFDQLNQT